MRREAAFATFAVVTALLSSPALAQDFLFRAEPPSAQRADPGSGSDDGIGGVLAVTTEREDYAFRLADGMNVPFLATGGTPPYRFELAGTLTGVSIGDDGILSGMVEPGTYSGVQVRLSDATSGPGILSRPIEIVVGEPGVLAAMPGSITGLDFVATRPDGPSVAVTFRNAGEIALPVPDMSVTGPFEIVPGSNTCTAPILWTDPDCEVRIRATQPTSYDLGTTEGLLAGIVPIAGRYLLPYLWIPPANVPTGRAGVPYFHDFSTHVVSRDVDDGQPLSWSSPDLPSGLDIDDATGIVAGTPENATSALGTTIEIAVSHPFATTKQAFNLSFETAAIEFDRIFTGTTHSCGFRVGGFIDCWGRNAQGELGNGSTADSSRARPATLVPPTGIETLSLGNGFSCALETDGDVICWGNGTSGQLGNGITANSLSPVRVAGLPGPATEIASGSSHACALVGRKAWCWGNNGNFQLGTGNRNGSNVPVPVAVAPGNLTALASSADSTCGLDETGGVLCWGDKLNFARHANGVASGVSSFSGRVTNGCAIIADGQVRCWTASGHSEIAVPGRVVEIGAGHDFSCALTDAGAVWCWGANGSGQLGQDSTTASSTPVLVKGLGSGVSGISIGRGFQFACATRPGGEASCWGYGDSGNLGGGRHLRQLAPAPVLAARP